MFYQSFMGWINYYIKQYSVSLIMHTSVPYARILEHFPDAMNHTGWLYFDTVICLLQSPGVLYFCVLSGKLFYFSSPSALISHLPPTRSSRFIWFGIWGLFHKERTRMCFSSTAPDICLEVNSFLRSRFLSGQAPTFILYAVMILHVRSIISTLYWCIFCTAVVSCIFALCSVFITGVTQPTQSAEKALYLQHHTYPVVPFNTY